MHNVEFFTDAQPAGLGTGLVGGGPREELPLDARLQPLAPRLSGTRHGRQAWCASSCPGV